jgi:DNA-binding PadR family transcriptional regulator
MSKIYQPIIIEKTDEIIETLISSNFFKDFELETTDFARTYFLDKLTEKFINGYDIEDFSFITEDDFDLYIKEIISGTVLYELKSKGILDSYEDESTEEVFFLTDNGKEFLKRREGTL